MQALMKEITSINFVLALKSRHSFKTSGMKQRSICGGKTMCG